MFCVDALTWFECVRAYLDSDTPEAMGLGTEAEFARTRKALQGRSYASMSVTDRLAVLYALTNLFLSTNGVRKVFADEGNMVYDDHCRSCHRYCLLLI